jgi:hypothetical protein
MVYYSPANVDKQTTFFDCKKAGTDNPVKQKLPGYHPLNTQLEAFIQL